MKRNILMGPVKDLSNYHTSGKWRPKLVFILVHAFSFVSCVLGLPLWIHSFSNKGIMSIWFDIGLINRASQHKLPNSTNKPYPAMLLRPVTTPHHGFEPLHPTTTTATQTWFLPSPRFFGYFFHLFYFSYNLRMLKSVFKHHVCVCCVYRNCGYCRKIWLMRP